MFDGSDIWTHNRTVTPSRRHIECSIRVTTADLSTRNGPPEPRAHWAPLPTREFQPDEDAGDRRLRAGTPAQGGVFQEDRGT
ncbi:hypothetical protein FHS38_002430 [Streptomyces netropsis]|uniref:Uncharacterized protein n=1 Tax=Streptomyces netropsis TaxID=55404 RepID=A0A7W7PE83_STRNE|nr:hypothetical protein [Streptomyces netropsis]GGR19929.1 hypothetical protein GCM10010219_25910 [Streptomyces netropsis]